MTYLKKITVFISLVICLLISASCAADYEVYENYGFLIDKSSISKKGDSIKVWVIIMDNGRIGLRKYAFVEDYEEFRCKDRTSATLESHFYNKKGNIISSVNYEKYNNVDYERIIPGSNGEILFNVVCGMK